MTGENIKKNKNENKNHANNKKSNKKNILKNHKKSRKYHLFAPILLCLLARPHRRILREI